LVAIVVPAFSSTWSGILTLVKKGSLKCNFPSVSLRLGAPQNLTRT
jgi:hypothetical protein